MMVFDSETADTVGYVKQWQGEKCWAYHFCHVLACGEGFIEQSGLL
jgi:hypothetical protein